jgi:hypothetical protein
VIRKGTGEDRILWRRKEFQESSGHPVGVEGILGEWRIPPIYPD